MKLAKVEIKNYRSIKDSVVVFDPSCRVLVGINESGKSNVLKALRLLGEEYKPSSKDDVRERVGREKEITESYVRFVFTLEKQDSDQLLSDVQGAILANDVNPEIVTDDGVVKPLAAFCAARTEGLYGVDVMTEKKAFKYWVLVKHKLVASWKKPSAACPADYSFDLKGKSVVLKNYTLVRSGDFPDIPVEYLEDATIEDLQQLSGAKIIDIVQKNLPNMVFWEYDESDLLPNSVDIAAFAANPDSCEPLKHMFVLAGISEDSIKTSIEKKLTGTTNQIQNYLDQIAEQTTAHFKEVWEEYRDISFSLTYHGATIVPGIKEANTHDFAKRSDGFKRFVTFLLMISVQVKTKQLENTLLLIDEPEISLHPSGARYLRNELIRIARQNYVAYSTHSIFMIDSADIGRHYIVKKKSEVTSLLPAEAGNIAEEEVLWNALGYSAFEILKEKNIIFEGWKDKKLFETALPGASVAIKKKFESVGICHAKGTSSMKAITPIIELAKRGCLIVSDGDQPAISEQKRYLADKGYGTWLTYQGVDASVTALTGEDFVKKDHIVRSVNASLAGGGMPVFTLADLPNDDKKLESISQWLTGNGMTADQVKIALSSIKNFIFENLATKDIESEYSKLLVGMNP